MGDPGYAASVDVDGSGTIDFDDITAVFSRWLSFEQPGRLAWDDASSIGYTGSLWDPLTRLSLMRRRWHDPYAGRWLTRDPAGYVDGLSLYLYVRGGPLRFVDPWGLASEKCYQVNGDLRDLEREMGIERGTGNHEPNELTDQQKEAGEQWEQQQGEFFREQGKKLLRDAGKATIGVAIIVSPADEAMVGAIAAKYGARAAARVIKAIEKAVREGKSASAVSKAAQEAAEKIQKGGAGKAFTRSQKDAAKDASRARNGGELRSDGDGRPLVDATKHEKGVTPPSNEAHVDHIKPRAAGGSNDLGNAQVLSREENLAKGAKHD